MQNVLLDGFCFFFGQYLHEKISFYILKPCREIGQSKKVCEDVSMLRTDKYFELIITVDVKNYADLGGCYPSRSLASRSVDNILLDLNNSSPSTQPHSIIVN